MGFIPLPEVLTTGRMKKMKSKYDPSVLYAYIKASMKILLRTTNISP